METVDYVFEGCGGYLSVNNLKEYKRTLKDNDRQPATINRRLAAANTYTTFLAEKYHNPHIKQLKVKNENVQPKQYIDNVITRADYEFLCAEAKKAKNPNLFIGIKIMGTTGVRLAELLQVKVEHIKLGYVDVLGKGAKRRRVYFPKAARVELLDFLGKLSGGVQATL